MSYGPGDQPIPQYRLEKFLGKGGFGEVWQATAPGGVPCAMKIIRLANKQGIREFRGIRIVREIRHPNLTPIIQFWLRDDHGHFIESSDEQSSLNLRGRELDLIIHMGLGDGSLRDRLNEAQDQNEVGIPLDELLRYMEDSARGLDYLNKPSKRSGSSGAVSIQHCDIKPENILLQGGVAQICDFGLAKVMNEVRSNSQTAGTFAYIAPEILKTNEPSRSSDQYSFAITYYELRMNDLPYKAQNIAQIIKIHTEGLLEWTGLAPEEQAVMKKATSLNPDERYASCEEMVRDLKRKLDQRSSTTSGTQINISINYLGPGDQVGHGYELKRKIGEGGYGEVWEATAPGDMPAAVKIIRSLERRKGQQEFKALELIKQLEHPYLLVLMGYWLLDAKNEIIPDKIRDRPDPPQASTLVIATKLASKNLLQRLQECQRQQGGQGGIPIVELMKYMRQAAEAIDYLNQSRHQLHGKLVAIQHRDIKPENILLTVNGDVKVGDFGLAKIVEGTNAAIGNNSVGLTMAYAAPEIFDCRVSAWSDQCSLAITYYYLRLGMRPFATASVNEIVQLYKDRNLNLHLLPAAEQPIISRATAFVPEERFSTCMDMVRELEAVNDITVGSGVIKRPTSGHYQRPDLPPPGVQNSWIGETQKPSKEIIQNAIEIANRAKSGVIDSRHTDELDKQKTVDVDWSTGDTPLKIKALGQQNKLEPVFIPQPIVDTKSQIPDLHKGGSTKPPDKKIITDPEIQTKKAPWGLVASIALILAAGGGAGWWYTHRDTQGSTKKDVVVNSNDDKKGGSDDKLGSEDKSKIPDPVWKADVKNALAAIESKDPAKLTSAVTSIIGQWKSLSDADKKSVEESLTIKKLDLSDFAETGSLEPTQALFARLNEWERTDLVYALAVASMKFEMRKDGFRKDFTPFFAQVAKAQKAHSSGEPVAMVKILHEVLTDTSMLDAMSPERQRALLEALTPYVHDGTGKERRQLADPFARQVDNLVKLQLEDETTSPLAEPYAKLLPLCREVFKAKRGTNETRAFLAEGLALRGFMADDDKAIAQAACEKLLQQRYFLYARAMVGIKLDAKSSRSLDQLLTAFKEEPTDALRNKARQQLAADEFYKAGVQLIDETAQGRRAFQLLEAAQRLAPSPEHGAKFLMAAFTTDLITEQNMPQVEEALKSVKEWNPTDREAVALRFIGWANKVRLQELDRLYRVLLGIAPILAEIKSKILAEVGKPNFEAELKARKSSLLFWLAYYYLRQDRKEDAKTNFVEALQLNPDGTFYSRIHDVQYLAKTDLIAILDVVLAKAAEDFNDDFAKLLFGRGKLLTENQLKDDAAREKPRALADFQLILDKSKDPLYRYKAAVAAWNFCNAAKGMAIVRPAGQEDWDALQTKNVVELGKTLDNKDIYQLKDERQLAEGWANYCIGELNKSGDEAKKTLAEAIKKAMPAKQGSSLAPIIPFRTPYYG